MTSDSKENLKNSVIEIVKEQVVRVDKYGVFILLAWGIGTIFLYFIQASLEGEPIRNLVVIVCLAYAIIFPIIGVKVYAGLSVVAKNSD